MQAEADAGDSLPGRLPGTVETGLVRELLPLCAYVAMIFHGQLPSSVRHTSNTKETVAPVEQHPASLPQVAIKRKEEKSRRRKEACVRSACKRLCQTETCALRDEWHLEQKWIGDNNQ